MSHCLFGLSKDNEQGAPESDDWAFRLLSIYFSFPAFTTSGSRSTVVVRRIATQTVV
jgi:hypothetical protein